MLLRFFCFAEDDLGGAVGGAVTAGQGAELHPLCVYSVRGDSVLILLTCAVYRQNSVGAGGEEVDAVEVLVSAADRDNGITQFAQVFLEVFVGNGLYIFPVLEFVDIVGRLHLRGNRLTGLVQPHIDHDCQLGIDNIEVGVQVHLLLIQPVILDYRHCGEAEDLIIQELLDTLRVGAQTLADQRDIPGREVIPARRRLLRRPVRYLISSVQT